ncbi:TonB-dependent receptor [Runella salmonicolor]|uniref:TonB-dependent receptor n=1 Tax=Runella salmonicolor TaxID=2950278 RepID=A0ABT1FW29_9BACT|nr:TonB-dependent receptor [Runella salmonicolor]MCP1385867.1 TonB-dependent receptor [Runella salmonicolor]
MSKHRQFNKLLLKIMRITCYQLFLTILCTSLGYAIDTRGQELLERKISVQVANQEIGRALERIEKVADVHFMYSPQLISSKRKVTLVAKNERLSTILEGLLRPLNIEYEVVGNKILLNRMPPRTEPENERAEPLLKEKPVDKLLKGRVIDAEKGDGLPGVSILLKGTQRGTSTNGDGEYSIALPDGESAAVLVFSFVGYEPQEIVVGNRTALDVSLKTDIKALSEVVVVGYGQVKKSDLTGSVASVKAKDITSFPITTPVQGMQGRVAGVQVIQNSGAPGSNISVRIRGGNSLRASNEPLYVVDGFALSGSLAALNPSDIESMEVLKDASATAIYGSRGANGVVIVTTKKGKAGKSQVDVESFYGIQSPTKLIEMMNAREMAEIANERATNDGVKPYFTQDEINGFGEGTNWQKELLRNAPIQNHGLTFSGGTERMQYSFSGNLLSQEGIVPNSSYKKGTIRGNINHRVSDKLTFDFSTILSRLNQGRIDGENSNRGNGALSAILVAPPTVAPFTPSGDYSNVVPYSFSSNVLLNPFALVNERTDKDVRDYVLANTAVNYEFIKGLSLRISGGIETFNSRQDQYSTRKLSTSPTGSASVSTSRQTNLLNENILNYVRSFNEKHNLALTGGVTYQNQKNNSLSAGGSGFASDVLTTDALQGAATPGIPGSGASEWTLLSYLGRVNYSMKDRYLFTASYRADGSSRFGKSNKWGYFPSAAFAWRVIEEDFLKDKSFLSDLKLRVSWGQTGNTALSPYQTLNSLASYQTIFGNDLSIGYAPSGSLSNPDLKWETTTQTDIGLDIGFWQDRIRLTADYYQKNTKDLLAIVSLPTSAGYTSTTQNIGEIQNSGVELGLDANLFSGEFKWDISANVSFNRNKVNQLVGGSDVFGSSLQNPLGVPVSLVRVGQPVGVFFGYQENGLNEKGEIVFKDLNNDGIINTNDKTIIGNPNPSAIFGFSSSASFKNFELNLFVQGVQGVDLFNFNVASFANSFNFGENQIKDLYVNRWTPQSPNPNAKYPKISVNTKFRESDRYVENGSFVRVKNIQLAYNLPTARWGLKWMRKAQVYVSGQNLLTLTKYSWYDPEVSTLGGGNSISPGVDQFGYPVAKTITFGARLGF